MYTVYNLWHFHRSLNFPTRAIELKQMSDKRIYDEFFSSDPLQFGFKRIVVAIMPYSH